MSPTQGTPARHFGVGFLFAGSEQGGESGLTNPWVVYEMGPSGMFLRWGARAIGDEADRAETFLESAYRPDLSMEACKRLAMRVCEHVLMGSDGQTGAIEMATLGRDEKGQPVFDRLSEKEIDEIRAMVLSEGSIVKSSSSEEEEG